MSGETKMTEEELQAEVKLIIETRLGILCGAADPTPEQMAIAVSEADEWLLNAED